MSELESGTSRPRFFFRAVSDSIFCCVVKIKRHTLGLRGIELFGQDAFHCYSGFVRSKQGGTSSTLFHPYN